LNYPAKVRISSAITIDSYELENKLLIGMIVNFVALAVLGLGRIGREVGIRMKTWGMRVIGFDPITSEAEARAVGIEKMELDEIWPLADYITVHVPLIPSTRSKNLQFNLKTVLIYTHKLFQILLQQ
jgi:lactate dehydrogenase-like 2-hydroxyacid dehydrogenase